MPKMPIRAASVPDEVLRQLADLGQVPLTEHDYFFQSVRENVDAACAQDALANGAWQKKGETLRSASVELYELLRDLDKDEQAYIEGIVGGDEGFIFDRISVGGVGGLLETTYQVAALFSLLTGKPDPPYPHEAPRPRKRGRRKGGVKDYIFQNFVSDLLNSTKAADGRLTIEKNIRTGTLITAIKMLAPHLPLGLVQKRLPTSTLQRLKTQCDKLFAEVDDRPFDEDEIRAALAALGLDQN